MKKWNMRKTLFEEEKKAQHMKPGIIVWKKKRPT